MSQEQPDQSPGSATSPTSTSKSSWKVRHRAGDQAALGKLGRFELRSALGKGAFGEVWRAYDPNLDRDVALKIPRFDDSDGKEAERFFREARAAAQLQHPNIVTVHDAGEADGQLYIASKLIDGQPLSLWLKENTPTFEQTAQIIRKLAEALHYAHTQGIFHRDIKPANVMIAVPSPDRRAAGGEGDREPFLMDFGLARRSDQEATMTMEGAMLGTPSYMSPEQAKGQSRHADARSDLYSLGVVLYEMLAGRKPFDGPPPMVMHKVINEEPEALRKINSKIPRDLETIAQKCLAKEQARRYPSAQHLAEELSRWLEGEPIQARPVKRHERLWLWCKRNPVVASLASLVVIAMVAGVVVSALFAVEATQRAEGEQAKAKEVTEALKASRRESAQLAIQQAIQMGEKGDADHALLWLARAYEHAAAADDDSLQMTCRRLLGSWAKYVNPVVGAFGVRGSRITACCICPNGKYVAVNQDGQVRVLETATSTPLGKPLPSDPDIVSMAFSPDGRILACTKQASTQLWNWETGRTFGKALEHPGPPLTPGAKMTVQFLASGRELLVACTGGYARLWDVATGKQLDPPIGPEVYNLAYISRDGQILITPVPWQWTRVSIWDVPTRKRRAQIQLGSNLRCIAFTPDGTQVAVGTHSHGVVLFDMDGKPVRDLARAVSPNHLEMAPTGEILATVLIDNTVRLSNWRTGESLSAPIRVREATRNVRFSPDGRFVFAATKTETRLYDVTRQELDSRNLRTYRNLPFSADERHYLVVTPEGAVQLHDLEPKDAKIPGKHLGMVAAGFQPRALNAESSMAILAHGNGQVLMFDCSNGKAVGPPLQLSAPALHFSFSNDGAAAVSCCATEAWLSDGKTGLPRKKLDVPGEIKAAEFTPDGRALLLLYATLPYRPINPEARILGDKGQLWDAKTGERLGEVIRFENGLYSFAFFPDSQRLLVGLAGGSVRTWNLRSGQTEGSSWSHQHPYIIGVAVSADSKLAVSGGLDSEARLWDVATGRAVGVPLIHSSAVELLALSPNGDLVATVTADGAVRLWDVPSGRPLGMGLQRNAYGQGKLGFSRDGKKLLVYEGETILSQPIYTVSVPTSAEAARLWVEVITGLEIDSEGSVRFLSDEAWRERRSRVHRPA